MKERITVAMCGLGGRGTGHLEYLLKYQPTLDFLGVCDLYLDRAENGAKMIKEARGNDVLVTTDYNELLDIPGLDCVIIATSWRDHIPVCIAAMKKGVRPGTEVAGAYSIDQLWQLVHTYEETKIPVMFLENCCYGREELMVLNMVRKGVFGDLVHVEGAYHHDLRQEVTTGRECRHYRLEEYKHRNCDNYPTHALGPLCQMLNINHGNRMLTLNSIATSSRGLNACLREPDAKNADLKDYPFNQGDVVTTIIKCANGETIQLTLDTCTPHAYSRGLRVQGTKAMYLEDNQSIFIDGVNSDREPHWKEEWDNFKNFRDEYEHRIWKDFLASDVTAGHGGIDHLVFCAFFDSVRNGKNPPIDVYDMAAWMAVTTLSEQSVAMAGAPVPVPDFTNGRWVTDYPCRFEED